MYDPERTLNISIHTGMRSYDNHGHTDKRYTIRILDRTPHRMFVPLALRSSDGRKYRYK